MKVTASFLKGIVHPVTIDATNLRAGLLRSDLTHST